VSTRWCTLRSGPAERLRGATWPYNPSVPSARLHLTFPERLVEEPVIYTIGKRFDLVTNLRRANINERLAWAIIEVEGTTEAIAEAVAWLTEQGIQVDRV
jgi:ABC-type methionine transport system ATPase subunit